MSQSRVAIRYATALFDQAVQNNVLESLIEDVRGLKAMITASRELTLFFQSPIIKVSQKSATLKALFEKAQFSKLMQDFLVFLVEKNRESEILPVLEAFEEKYNAQKSVVAVAVTSAFEMDADQRAKLLAQVEKNIGKKPVATYTIDASLIGGFTVKIGDQIMDGSIKHQLEILKKRLNAGVLSN